jgi:tetratricopeptide (TPR) repeat protein
VNSLTRLARALAFIDPDRCIAVCERAVALSRTQDDPLLQARSEMLAACWRIITHGWRKEDAAICATARDRIRLSDEVPAYYEILYAHVQYIQGDYLGAYETAKAGIPKSVENDSLVVYLSAHSSLAQALLQLGRLGELMEVLSNALDIAQKNRNAPWLGIFQATLAWVRLQCRDVAGANQAAGDLLREYRDQRAGQVQTMAMLTAAWANLESGSVDSALASFAEVVEGDGRFFLDWYWRRIARLGLGNAYLKQADLAAAGREADLFLESALATADPGLKALAWELKARVALAGGDHGGALECVNRGLEGFEGFEVPLVAWKVHLTASACYRSAGDSPSADRHRASAAAILSKLADSLPDDQPLRKSLLSGQAE